MEDTKVRIELESKDAINSIKDLRNALKAAKDEMVGLEPGSKAFLQAAKNAGELQHQMNEIQQSVRGASADFGDMVGNVAKAGAGITGAFQAAQGAMKLMGGESEDVAKAIEKMQSLMAMTQGLSSIDQGIKAFGKLKTAVGLNNKELGGFKKALIGTGLGALVVVLGSIISNWDEFTQAIGLSEKQMNKFGEVAGGVMNVLTGSVKTFTKAITKAITGDFKGAWEELKGGLNISKLYAEGVAGAITKREEEELKTRLKAHEEYAKKMEAEYDRQRSKAEATIQDETERTNELIKIEKNRLKLYAQGTKEYYDQVKKINDLQASLTKEAKPEKQTEEKEDPEITKLRNRVQALKDSYRDELQVINDEEQNKLIAIQTAQEKELISEQEFQDLKTQIEQEAEEKRTLLAESQEKIRLALLEEEKQKQVDMIHNISDVAAAASGLLTNVLMDIADAQDASTKEGFEKQKKLQIAAATIQMLTGIATAFTGAYTTKSGPWDFVLMGIQAASIAAAGAVNIAKIKQQKFDGGGNSASSGAATARISNAAASIRPIQMTQDIQGAEISSAIKDTKVYVTETDISNTQNKVNVAESESRY